MKKLTIYLSLLLIVATTCKKYEEGPAISLRSKENRLYQTWKGKEIYRNGEVEEVSYNSLYMKLEKAWYYFLYKIPRRW